jgi:glutathione S-transferase
MFTLVIGNKCYSSWSLRPWMLLRHFDIPFEEIVVPLYEEGSKEQILKHSPAGKVPILKDGDITVWESLAIMDHVAETRPDLVVWPKDKPARAFARSIATEMHAGFAALRNACSMNLGKKFPTKDRGADVDADVKRITAVWREARQRFGERSAEHGPFLFGAFTAADAMYAPVVTRFETYSIPVDDTARTYMDALMSSAAFRDWRAAALKEAWVLPHVEADEKPLEVYRQVK